MIFILPYWLAYRPPQILALFNVAAFFGAIVVVVLTAVSLFS
jgi:hypothetical protein